MRNNSTCTKVMKFCFTRYNKEVSFTIDVACNLTILKSSSRFKLPLNSWFKLVSVESIAPLVTFRNILNIQRNSWWSHFHSVRNFLLLALSPHQIWFFMHWMVSFSFISSDVPLNEPVLVLSTKWLDKKSLRVLSDLLEAFSFSVNKMNRIVSS